MAKPVGVRWVALRAAGSLIIGIGVALLIEALFPLESGTPARYLIIVFVGLAVYTADRWWPVVTSESTAQKLDRFLNTPVPLKIILSIAVIAVSLALILNRIMGPAERFFVQRTPEEVVFDYRHSPEGKNLIGKWVRWNPIVRIITGDKDSYSAVIVFDSPEINLSDTETPVTIGVFFDRKWWPHLEHLRPGDRLGFLGRIREITEPESNVVFIEDAEPIP